MGTYDIQSYQINRFKYPLSTEKNHKPQEEIRKYRPFKGKNKPAEIAPQKGQKEDLKFLKQLSSEVTENRKTIRKMTYSQDGNYSKVIKNLKETEKF